jgi:Aldehyde dehydrogenase family
MPTVTAASRVAALPDIPTLGDFVAGWRSPMLSLSNDPMARSNDRMASHVFCAVNGRLPNLLGAEVMAIKAINPVNGKIFATYDEMMPSVVSGIISDVNEAFLKWRHTSFEERAAMMREAARMRTTSAVPLYRGNPYDTTPALAPPPPGLANDPHRLCARGVTARGLAPASGATDARGHRLPESRTTTTPLGTAVPAKSRAVHVSPSPTSPPNRRRLKLAPGGRRGLRYEKRLC